jgi:nitrite reductase/ring-hydroxylating ferredoxin subunit
MIAGGRRRDNVATPAPLRGARLAGPGPAPLFVAQYLGVSGSLRAGAVKRKGRSVSASEWIATLDESEVPEGGYAAVYPKGIGVLLVRIDGALHAVANKCFHMGCPLEGGRLRGAIITCPCHDWHFDVRDGRFITAPELRLRKFATKVEDGKVLVDVGGA